jgi:hypothetical protein
VLDSAREARREKEAPPGLGLCRLLLLVISSPVHIDRA